MPAPTPSEQKTRRSDSKATLDAIVTALKPFRKGASPKAVPSNLGSGEPLAKLSAAAEALHAATMAVHTQLQGGTWPRLGPPTPSAAHTDTVLGAHRYGSFDW